MVRRRGGSSNAGSFQPSKTGRSGSSPQQGVKANSFQGGQKSSSPVKFNVSSIHKRGPSKLQMRAFQEPEDIEMQDSSLSRTGQKPFYKTTHSISENSVLEFVKDDVEAAHRGAVATYVEISGLPPFPSLKDLLALLKRKSQKPFQTVSKIQFSPGQDMCYLHIKNKAQAAALQAISGISFRDHKLTLRMLPENSILPDLESSSGDATMQNASSSFADTQKTHIKETILSKNLFFVEQQYADLSDLNNKMTRVKVDFASRSFCATLLSVLQGLLEASGLTSVVALNLSKNRIFTFRYVPEATSEVLFKSVKFLNLENNEFHRIAELLEYLKKKFPLLEHLSLLGNDELLRHAQSDKKVTGTSLLIPERLDFLFTYCQTILKTLPNIQVLDQIPVLQFIRELLLGTPQLPLLSAPLRGSWFDLPATAETVQSFITQFFTFYDSRRMDLGQIYDEDSILAISSVSLQFLKERNAGLYRQASIYLWMEYMKQNRTSLPNLFSLLGGSSIKGSASTSFLYKGAKEIGLFVNQYPPTRHLLESFIVDCWQSMEPLSKLDLPSESSGQTTPTLSILLYGKYQEQVDGAGALIAEREFLRVFVLIPSKSGSIGQVAGWPVRVLMDRIYLLNPPIENAAIPVPTLPLLYSPAELEALQGLSETKRTLVESFSQTTQLTLLFALECLTQNHWVLEDAQKAYTILKSKRKFPKNAFKSSI